MKARVVIGVLLVAAAVAAFFLLRKPAPTTVAVADAGSATASKPPERPITEKPPGDDSAGGGPATEQRIDVEDDPPGKLSLEGQVIDSQELPVGGALVSLSSNPPRTTKSEADGSFTFEKLVGRAYTVAARKDDLHGGPVTVRLTAKTEPVVVRVAPAGGLEVTAVDFETRKPIAGADIEVDAELGIGGTTGADGKATLRGVPAGFQEVVARADGYAPSMSFAEVAGKEGVIDKHTVELKAGAGVSGKVVDPNGKPVAGAEVRADSASGFFDMPRGKKDRVRTDGSGNWSFPALPAGTFRFVARHDKHGPGTSAPLTLDGKNARKDVTIRLEEGGRIAGKVVRKSGEPVPAAAVRVVVADRGFTFDVTRQAFTDDKGAFDIGGLPRRPVEVAAFAEDASSATVPVDLVAKPEQLEVTLTVDVEGMIGGTVVNAKGEAIPEAQVMAVPSFGERRSDPSEWQLRGTARDVTDSGGRFELRGLPDGTYRLRASRGGGGFDRMWQREPVEAKVGDKELKIVLEDDGKVKGRVLYTDGSPPDAFNVSTSFGRGQAFAGEGGAFEVTGPAGKALLTVSGPGFVQKMVPDIEIKPNETTDVGTINVEKGRSISGRVLHSDGSPVAGAKVMGGPQLMGSGSELQSGGIFGGGGGLKTATSGDDGSYTLAGVGAKGLVMVADHPTEGRSSMVRVPPSDQSTTLDLTLAPPGALEGVVTREGKPVAETFVMAMPQQAARGNFIVQTGADGTYRYDKLAPDSYRVTAIERGGTMGASMHSKVAAVESGKTVKLDLEVPAGGVAVTMKLAPPEGVVVNTAQIFLVQGQFNAPNAEVFNELFGELGAGASHQGFMMKGEPLKFASVKPGSYSACAIPIPGDINSPADMMKIRDKMDKLLVGCQPAEIKATPAEQEVSVKVPAPPPL